MDTFWLFELYAQIKAKTGGVMFGGLSCGLIAWVGDHDSSFHKVLRAWGWVYVTCTTSYYACYAWNIFGNTVGIESPLLRCQTRHFRLPTWIEYKQSFVFGTCSFSFPVLVFQEDFMLIAQFQALQFKNFCCHTYHRSSQLPGVAKLCPYYALKKIKFCCFDVQTTKWTDISLWSLW